MPDTNAVQVASLNGPLRLIGNIIWVLFGGLFMAIGWALAGIFSFITIIGIPWGIAAFRIASFSLWPFGREMVDRKQGVGMKTASLLGNIIWIVLCGWWIALGHLISALLCAVTIIGIPFAWQHIKLAALSLTPLGKEIVLIDSRSEAYP
ncbi:MAG: hypothetical protein UBAL2_80490401 [Leptospirillum rubarum]|uniref:Inner membrane component domain-containing protein n=1 Tax=Leptospirillum sp. Group II '5-way CG' TaxID=419541 RepID=B6AS63_9BACT|nr:MAG: hypothetical protein UBAL2_80490401 [Leptospirillum rubarum]EDZ38319.1 MAG: Protein of unknown function [Leptospirillum sp. Group II '5-way CG']